MVGLSFTHLAFPVFSRMDSFKSLRKPANFLFPMGLLFSLLWLTILILENWISIKNLRKSLNENNRLKFYAIFAFFLTSLETFLIIADFYELKFLRSFGLSIVVYFYIVIFALILFGVFFLFAAGVKIYQLSRDQTNLELSKLGTEKKR
jgi:hypothetical protein